MSAIEFEAAVLPHLGGLSGHAMTLTRDSDAAADLVQDTMLRALRFWHRFDGRSLSGWLHTMMRRIYLGSIKSDSRRREVMAMVWIGCGPTVSGAGLEQRIPDPESEYLAHLERARDRYLVEAALDRLPSHQHMVVWAVDIEGWTYLEAMDEFKCSVGTLASKLSRGRKAMRAAVDELLAERGEDLAA